MPIDQSKCKFKNGNRVKILSKSSPDAPVHGNVCRQPEEGEGGAPKYLVRYMLPNDKVLHEDYFGDEQLELAKEGK